MYDFFVGIVEVDLEKDEDEEEPDLEGRINVEKDDFITTTTTQISTEPSIRIDDECHLPYYPAADPDLENTVWRFGTFAKTYK